MRDLLSRNTGSSREHWLARLRPTTLRQTLIVGLLPGLVVLVVLAAIAWYAVDVMANANAELAETGWELAATRALQLNFQQTLIPFNNHLISESRRGQVEIFNSLADDLDRRFATAGPAYEEAEEQLYLNQARFQWQIVRKRAEDIMVASPNQFDSTEVDQAVAKLQADAQIVWQNLEQLHDAVFQEMQRSVQASQSARRVATGLIFVSTLGAFVLGVLFVLFFSNYITRPLDTLEAGAARIGGGDLAFRLDLKRSDEIGALAREFDRMATRLQDVYQHLEDRVAERTAQLRALNEAGQSVVGELQLERVLQTIADLARSLGNAEYAAVLVPRIEEEAPPRFIVSQGREIDLPPNLDPPLGEGLLGALLSAEAPIRADQIAAHPAAQGLPAGHPPMTSFLGIPIRVRERTIGGLYLTDKRGGDPFDQEDEQILTMLAAYAGIAIENARLYIQLTRMNEALEARVQERTAELEAVSAERARYAAQLRQVLNRTVRVQEGERQRIAKGIHDGVSQWLMGALFELQAARVRLPEDLTEIEQHLSEAQRVLKEVKEEMRRVIYDLHPPLLESNGLVAALRGHVAEVQAHGPLRCAFRVSGAPQRLPAEQELAIFRIAQEAMNNAMKHARTDTLEVILVYEEHCVCLRVADQGQGFDPDSQRSGSDRSRLGLMSMAERAVAVGATLKVESQPGCGTQVEVRVPLDGMSADGPDSSAA